MSTGRNIAKIIVGSALGTAVAAGVAKVMQRQEQPEEERVPLSEQVRAAPINLRDRWDRAKAAGVEAESAETARLNEAFRAKVNDPTALTPPRPPSR